MSHISNIYLPKVSIVTVCFQSKNSIEKTIRSVLGQDYPNLEYIIQDGGSTDGTLEIIKRYPNLSWISQKDYGVYDAMNKAVKRVSGEWVLFMNAGDTFYNNEVVSYFFLRRIPQSCFVLFGDTISQNDEGDKIIRYLDMPWHKYMPSCHQSIFCKTEILQKYPFDLKWKIAADRAFFFNLYKRQYTFLYYPIIVSVYDNSGGISHNYLECTKEILKIHNSNLLYLFKYFVVYLKFKLHKIYSSLNWKI